MPFQIRLELSLFISFGMASAFMAMLPFSDYTLYLIFLQNFLMRCLNTNYLFITSDYYQTKNTTISLVSTQDQSAFFTFYYKTKKRWMEEGMNEDRDVEVMLW